MKTKVSSNLGAPYAWRFFNSLWTYRVSQLTTSNMRQLRDTGIAMSFDQGNGSSSGGSESSGAVPIQSDLHPHALHKFPGDPDWSIVIAVPRSSVHSRNVLGCPKVSLMVGHTDPQLFHWFKQLGTIPPRAVITGAVDILSGDLRDDCWGRTFIRHPVIHTIAQDMWEKKESKTTDEQVHIAQREREEDEKRMRRMSSSDWRSKFKDRERNPTTGEDEEKPIYVVKPETFSLLRLKPEVKLWMNVGGQAQRVWDPAIPDADPLCRCSHRFIRMLNLARQKLVSSLNMNFSLKLTNAFIFEIDEKGLWALGTQENFSGKNGIVREEWSELRLEFGKNQIIKTEQEMEWWVRGLTKLGAPEISQTDNSLDDAAMNPEEFEYRHI
ncbi:unnamed protein product [Phytomonas sp. Hart1]|nr:unnamed protein product [Phytomonas sp. Hart1]|eukprot:CCW69070.1 unnamed protein product [Phytomonas sp. isolate Hart1]